MRKVYSAKDMEVLNKLYDAMTNDGYVLQEEDGEVGMSQMSFKDLVTTKDATRFIPQTVTTIIREALEPSLLVVPNCFNKVRIEPGQTVRIGAIGSISAGKVPEGAEYPRAKINYDHGDMVALTVEKYGLQVYVTEEVINMNLWDVFGMFLRYSGRALARLQEDQAIKLLNAMGTTVFDNYFPTESQYGVTTGRDITGTQNGSMTANDIFDMYAWLLHRGFNPDTLIMNPLAWKMFMTDPETREVVLKGSTLASRRLPSGSYSPGWGSQHNGLGVRTQATGTGPDEPATAGSGYPPTTGKIGANPWVNTLNPLANTFQLAPSYLPSPMKVLVTPHVRYTRGSEVGQPGKSDLIMLDSEMCGIMGTNGGGIDTEEFDEPQRDIRAMKVRQFWGFGVLEQGRGVATARDVIIARNYNFENTNSQDLSALDHTSAINQSNVTSHG